MTKKIFCIGLFSVLMILIASCEKDFTEINTDLVNNSKFTTDKTALDVTFKQKNIDFVVTGNNLGNYWLGIYKKPNAKIFKAGFIWQVAMPSKLKDDVELKEGESLSNPHLDEVILKIPVPVTLEKKISKVITNSEGNEQKIKVPEYKLKGLLGNIDANFDINVYRNGTYLNKLNPVTPSENKKYYSNDSFIKIGEKLNISSTINLKNIEKDSIYVFNRTLTNGSVYKDTLKIVNTKKSITSNPFIVIKLDKERLKKDIFSQYNSDNFISQRAFKDYFRGIVLEVTGNDGCAIPLDLSGDLIPSIDFLYTRTILKDGKPAKNDQNKIKRLEKKHSFYLEGVKTSKYSMGKPTSLADNVILQGTSGSIGSIEILNKDSNGDGILDIQELRKKNIIINEAKLVFDINTKVDTTNLPKQLFLFKKEVNNGIEKYSPIGLKMEPINFFGGFLEFEDEKPVRYTFRIRNYINQVINEGMQNSELILRVFNPDDYSSEEIKEHNWNPRSVVLLSNSTKNGTVKGVKLKLAYTTKNK